MSKFLVVYVDGTEQTFDGYTLDRIDLGEMFLAENVTVDRDEQGRLGGYSGVSIDLSNVEQFVVVDA